MPIPTPVEKRALGARNPLPRLRRQIRRHVGRLSLGLQIYVLLVVMRGIITVMPLRRIGARLGERRAETPSDGLRPEQLLYAKRVGRGIRRIAPLTPTNSNCYPQALTAWWLLRRRGIPTTFYYGAAFNEEGTELEAHTWLRCGPLVVTGGGTHLLRFPPLIWFADHARTARRGAR
jgi:hypothetical protein